MKTEYTLYEGSQGEWIEAGDYREGTWRIVALRDYSERKTGKGWTLREPVSEEALASFETLTAHHRIG